MMRLVPSFKEFIVLKGRYAIEMQLMSGHSGVSCNLSTWQEEVGGLPQV